MADPRQPSGYAPKGEYIVSWVTTVDHPELRGSTYPKVQPGTKVRGHAKARNESGARAMYKELLGGENDFESEYVSVVQAWSNLPGGRKKTIGPLVYRVRDENGRIREKRATDRDEGLRSRLIRVASSLPSGDQGRRGILALLRKGRNLSAEDSRAGDRLTREKTAGYPSGAELRDSVVIGDSRRGYSVSAEGRHLGEFQDWDDAVEAARRWMDRESYWPDLYYVNDHGNLSLLDEKGDKVKSWV